MNASQRLDFVIVRYNTTMLQTEPTFRLLPDGAIIFNASAIRIDHDLFVALNAATPDHWDAPSPLNGEFGYQFDETGLILDWWTPDAPFVTSELEGQHRLTRRFDDEWLGYDQLGPFNRFGQLESDTYVAGEASSACYVITGTECPTTVFSSIRYVQAATPAVVVGLEVYDAIIENAAATERDFVMGARQTPEEIASRRSVEQPAASRPGVFEDKSGQLWTVPASAPAGAEQPLRESPLRSRDSDDESPHIPRSPATPPIIPLTAAFALAVLAAALYSRLKREDLIQAPHRARILAALEERGPLRLAALARLVGVDRTTVCYHAELLERAGLVQTLRAGRSAYLALPKQQLPPSSRAGGELGVAVQELLALHGGGLPRAQLHEMLPGVPQRTRNHALRQLLAAGAVLETPTETGTLLSLAR